jgi:DNA-directed RNA polymerase specialized sigma24 family protein
MRTADKRGGGAPHVSIDDVAGSGNEPDLFTEEQASDLLVLEDALGRLATFNARGADIVQYRFFGGLSHPEIAEVLGVAEVTVRRAWTMAKTWLRRELGDDVATRSGTVLRGGESADADDRK